MPRISRDQLRQAAKRFKKSTASGCDGLSPAQMDLLGDEAIDALATIYQAMEITGVVPR